MLLACRCDFVFVYLLVCNYICFLEFRTHVEIKDKPKGNVYNLENRKTHTHTQTTKSNK